VWCKHNPRTLDIKSDSDADSHIAGSHNSNNIAASHDQKRNHSNAYQPKPISDTRQIGPAHARGASERGERGNKG
jgi:hypothetical protein